MELRPKQPTTRAPLEWFTGEVWVDPIARPDGSAHANVSAVHFHPGARSAWHSHSTGQTLYVTEGEGRVQSRGEPVHAIRAGDIVHTPAEEWHWHGSRPPALHDSPVDHRRRSDLGRSRHRRRVPGRPGRRPAVGRLH